MTRLLLDTHVVLAVFDERLSELGRHLAAAVRDEAVSKVVSVVSLWEIAIKNRLGKLVLQPALAQIPELLAALQIDILPIEAAHVLASVEPLPATRDPFDRLLLAQCQTENMRLGTCDRALAAHPLAWRPT